ncbi:DUF3320 domain-containing protein [Soonwooa purpurea]
MSENLNPEIHIKNAPYFNYTFCLNKYNFIFEIIFQNIPSNLENIKIEITSSLGIFEKYRVFIDRISANTFSLSNFEFNYQFKFLKSLIEKDIDTIKIILLANDTEIISTQFNMDVLPMDYFGGLQILPQLLGSYVTPNHPTIYQIKSDAINILEQNGYPPAFEGYQNESKERVLQMTSALYKAIQNQELIYSALPPSFENQGQRIRLVEQIMETKFGNCIDITLLFASCLEAIDLNPIIIFTKGHAFVGVWLEDLRFDAMINFDQAAISKRIASGIKEIAIIETTTLCKGSSISFSKAMASAEKQLMSESDFLLSIDIKNTRSNGVLPLPMLKQDSEFKKEIQTKEENPDTELDDNYDIGETYDNLELTDFSNLSKQKIWERKLLDLSLRNNLLNLRFTKSMLQIIDLKINLLEDTLAEGKSYTIHPDNNQAITRKYNNYIPPLHTSSDLFKLADDEFKYNRLLTTYHNDDLDSILTNLYRTSKLAEEENGKSTLYLGLGLLKWFDPKNKTTPRFAPILLIPVELSRKSVNTKYTLRSREEETMINITLIEYLKQEYNLNLNALENLPMDEFGVDVPRVLAIIRNAVLNLEGWDVLDQIVLGTFSFNKLILWQDLSKYSEEIQKSSIVKSLIDGKLTETLESVEGNHLELEDLSSASLTLPIPTDNSQLNAVNNANQNKTFILHGPPGTGKSQTITNIIADALANHKKVLFVAAKKAALDVVHRRLESIGLAPFCLELHSNKSKKSDVLKQFEQALETPKYQLNKDFLEEAKRLDDRKKEINKYITQLHHKNQIGWTLYDSISFLENNAIAFHDVPKIDIDFKNLSSSKWNLWNDWLLPFSSIAAKIGQPTSHPLHLVTLSAHRFDHQNNLSDAIENYRSNYEKGQNLFNKYQINIKKIGEFERILNFIKGQKIQAQLFDFYFDPEQNQLLKQWLDLTSKKQNTETSITQKFNKSIFENNLDTMQILWNQAKHTWFFPKWLKQRKVKNLIQGFAHFKIDSEQIIDQLFRQLENYKDVKNKLSARQYDVFESLNKTYFKTEILETDFIKKDLQNIENLEQLLPQSAVENPEEWLKSNFANQDISQEIEQILSVVYELKEAKTTLGNYLSEIPNLEKLTEVHAHLSQLESWINYNIYKEKAQEIDLKWCINLLEEGKLNPHEIPFEFNKTLHFNHFIQTTYEAEVLNSFDANIYESKIQQYKDLHKEFIDLSKNKLIVKLSSNIPNINQEAAQSSEIGFLQKAIRSKGRGLSIRRLFDQIPTLIPRLKPCMLMSPISVAQYFDVNTDHFDLVIFDEASQLPTSEAISALARAKQAIIVGDPKQMPPTSFFASSKVDEDNIEMEDLESILEDCLALSIPSNYLLRHYRSKHESLISFSNKNFYDSKLLTFPSPDDLNQKVTFEFVEGFYDKGKTRTNKNEALAIINYIKKHLASENTKSIGVVTFSQTQQTLIEDLLQKLFIEYPKLEEFALKTNEPIFIKNLENVQGDERDIILFSIGYGPDEENKISMNFGPLNRDGGWRRLNVAVTRARYEMKVFSTLKPDQIDLNRTKSEGVKGLKDFLNFAEKGNYALKVTSENESKISLIDSIVQHLEKTGLVIRKNIGTSDYKVDLGIVHPEKEKEYILGILVDGENYFNIHTTNDRELLAPNVLSALNWNIYRIWTLDWLKNKHKIVHDIIEKVEFLKHQANEEKIEETISEDDPGTPQHTLIKVEKTSFNKAMMPYVCAVFEANPTANSESIYFLENRPIILNQIREIVSTEAPISKNYLFRKILKLWNTTRAGAKLNNYLTEITESIPTISKNKTHQEFYWNDKITPDNIQFYRENSFEKRNIEDISQEEIQIVILEIIEANLSLSTEDLIRQTSKAFGFMKVGAQIDNIINSTIESLVKQENIKILNNRVNMS